MVICGASGNLVTAYFVVYTRRRCRLVARNSVVTVVMGSPINPTGDMQARKTCINENEDVNVVAVVNTV